VRLLEEKAKLQLAVAAADRQVLSTGENSVRGNINDNGGRTNNSSGSNRNGSGSGSINMTRRDAGGGSRFQSESAPVAVPNSSQFNVNNSSSRHITSSSNNGSSSSSGKDKWLDVSIVRQANALDREVIRESLHFMSELTRSSPAATTAEATSTPSVAVAGAAAGTTEENVYEFKEPRQQEQPQQQQVNTELVMPPQQRVVAGSSKQENEAESHALGWSKGMVGRDRDRALGNNGASLRIRQADVSAHNNTSSNNSTNNNTKSSSSVVSSGTTGSSSASACGGSIDSRTSRLERMYSRITGKH
jgi:hypothetical protein